jgi:hypothetical protein
MDANELDAALSDALAREQCSSKGEGEKEASVQLSRRVHEDQTVQA